MKESDMESAPEAWQSTLHMYEFANYAVQLDPGDYGMALPTNTGENPTDLDELVLLKNKVTIPAFESIILHCHTCHMMMMGYKLHMMTQATYLGYTWWRPTPNYMMEVAMCRLSSGTLRESQYICLLGGQWDGLWLQMPSPMPPLSWNSSRN